MFFFQGYVLKPYDLRGLSGEEAAPAATPDQTLKVKKEKNHFNFLIFYVYSWNIDFIVR